MVSKAKRKNKVVVYTKPKLTTKDTFKKLLKVATAVGVAGLTGYFLNRNRLNQQPKMIQEIKGNVSNVSNVSNVGNVSVDEDKLRYNKALKELSNEIKKVKFILVKGETRMDVCDAYYRLFRYITKSCEYAMDQNTCKIKRFREYDIDIKTVNDAVKELKCIY